MKLCSQQMNDNSYFDSYADIAVHEEMLCDENRTNAYKKAIFGCANELKNKVVLDVGSGTGILSVFCAKAGAKKVYAVEASNIAQQARKIIKLNGVDKIVEVIQGVLEDISLPEKVDVIVSEWMGYCLLYESMLTSVLTARDRWLKPNGLILPSIANIYFAPICDDEIMCEKVNLWNDMKECYGVDMSCLTEFARKSIAKEVMVKSIFCENILSQPSLLVSFDLYTVKQEELNSVAGHFTFKSFGMADLQGFALWFEVTFPTSQSTNHQQKTISNNLSQHNHTSSNNSQIPLTNGKVKDEENLVEDRNEVDDLVVLSTSPYKPDTHWKQSILYLNNAKVVQQDTLIEAKVCLSPNSTNRRFLDIQLECLVNNQSSIQNYLMGYETPATKDY